ERLKTEFKDKVEILQLPVPVLRDLKKLSADVVKEQSEKTPTARKVHASFTKFQALVGPWDHVAEGAYHQLVAGGGGDDDNRAAAGSGGGKRGADRGGRHPPRWRPPR